MKLSFITDEATQSFEEAVAFARRLGLSGLELRSVEDQPIDRIPRETLRAWRKRLDGEGLAVPCLSGSFFKCGFREDEGPELEKLARLCAAAETLDCRLIRGFAFFRPEEGMLPPQALAPRLERLGEMLRSRGLRLLLEADPSVNTTNHAALASLLELLDPAAFGAIYDPGNDLYDPLGEIPYPNGYEAIRPYLAHVHVKDAVYGAGGGPVCVAPGEGLVGWGAVLRRLRADGYSGWLSLETHYRKRAVLTEEQMRIPQGRSFTEGGLEATEESALALGRLLEEMGGTQWQ